MAFWDGFRPFNICIIILFFRLRVPNFLKLLYSDFNVGIFFIIAFAQPICMSGILLKIAKVRS